MDSHRINNNTNDQPLCRFGPGGDYVSDWTVQSVSSAHSNAGKLGKVLAALGDIIGATLNPQMLENMQADIELQTEAIHKMALERIEGDDRISAIADNTKTADSTKTDSRLRGKTMLFSDDWGTGRKAQRKPHHRIRAHSGTSRKRAGNQIKRQGTLFEADRASQSAA